MVLDRSLFWMRYFMYWTNKKSIKTLHVVKVENILQNYTQNRSKLRFQTLCRIRNSDCLVSSGLPLQNQNCKIFVIPLCYLFAYPACTFNQLLAFQHTSFEVFCPGSTLNIFWDPIQKLTDWRGIQRN